MQVLHHRILKVYRPHVLEPLRHAGAPAGPASLFPLYVFARCDVRNSPVRGRLARALAGPFAGNEGLVERPMPASDRVRLLLMSAGGGRGVDVEARQIKWA